MSSGWARSAWAEFIQRTTVLTPDSWLLNWEAGGGGSNNGFLGWEIAAAGQRAEWSTGTQGWQWAAWEWPATDPDQRQVYSDREWGVRRWSNRNRYHGVIRDNGGDGGDRRYIWHSLRTEESSFLDVIMSDCQMTNTPWHHVIYAECHWTGIRQRSGPDIYRDDRRLCQAILVTLLHCSLKGLVWKYEHNR